MTSEEKLKQAREWFEANSFKEITEGLLWRYYDAKTTVTMFLDLYLGEMVKWRCAVTVLLDGDDDSVSRTSVCCDALGETPRAAYTNAASDIRSKTVTVQDKLAYYIGQHKFN